MAAYSTRYTFTSQAPRASSSGAAALYGTRLTEAQGLLSKLSDQELQDLLASFRGTGSQMQQDITSRGLSATTILPSMRMGLQRQQQAAVNSLNDQRTRQQLDVLGQYTQGQAGAMQQDAAARNAMTSMGYSQSAALQQQLLNRAGQRTFSSGGSTGKRYNNTIFSRQVNSYPGSYSALQRRYA